MGREIGLPVIQAGTGLHAADCFTQGVVGPLLDDQMHGALTAAAAREEERARGGGCAADPGFVAPGMMAAALMVYRFVGLGAAGRDLSPLVWRSGGLPVEGRRKGHVFAGKELTV